MVNLIDCLKYILQLGFAFIPSNWFYIVLPAGCLVALVVAIRRL